MAAKQSSGGTAVLQEREKPAPKLAIGPVDGDASYKRATAGRALEAKDKGALIVREHRGRPFYEAKWRDLNRKQKKRRLGLAWVEKSGAEWIRRRGRVRDGFLDDRRAFALMAEVIEKHEQEVLLEAAPLKHLVLFDDVVAAWLVYLETEKRVKPSTLAGYENLLAEPTGKPRQRGARIMREFGGKPIFDIAVADAKRFLSKLDREDISARTVNIHRQVLHSIFEFARDTDTFGLVVNPIAGTTKRPEDGAKPIEVFERSEIRAIAGIAREGQHRRRSGYEGSRFSAETEREWSRINHQDAALFDFAFCTGLRLGELLALRWRDVDLRNEVVTVSRALSGGKETSTKSRRSRIVPLAAQAISALRALQRRGIYIDRDDLVFCRPDGGHLDRGAVRKRFITAQKKAGVRVRRFHDLRHSFGTKAIRKFDLVTVKDMMGHSKLTTTERYLHSQPRPSDAAKLTSIFQEEEEPMPLAA